ncbi:MAG: hypothetical protein JOZ23_05520 [Mycobacterium sp.]|nr:hypothetical protein [Mycobacterium sp.]
MVGVHSVSGDVAVGQVHDDSSSTTMSPWKIYFAAASAASSVLGHTHHEQHEVHLAE